MNHKLRVIVRLDIDLHWARMDVRGCLTEENCRALLPIVRRSYRILQEPTVVIDASGAQHIDREGVEALGVLGVLGVTVPADPAGRTAEIDPALTPPLAPTLLTPHREYGSHVPTCRLIVSHLLPACPSRTSRPHGSHRFAA